MVNIEIDGKTYSVNPDDNLLQACLSAGLDLPYFCWHPAMGSVGACRQCAAIQYSGPDDETGRLIVGCMTPVSEGLRVSLDHGEAKQFRAEVIELLMTNHPHDCPVCEEGGQCHLQDMTVMAGHTARRYRGKKRTHTNQYLGPFVSHEMNRCIACYRCVRYYNDYAGGKDLGVFASHNHVYFGRSEDGVLENEFSGNLVEVCPTGVFTDKTYGGAYSRKWDMQTAPSICVHCSVGCNITPGERYGEVRSIVNRYHSEINGYFLCDRGRFGYGFVNSPTRLKTPSINHSQIVSSEVALDHFKALLKNPEKVVGIGSPRASVEANFALREMVGKDRFYAGVEDSEFSMVNTIIDSIQHSPAKNPSVKDIEAADAIFILGEDLTNTAPRLALAVRQAVRNKAVEFAASLGIPKWQDAAVRQAAQELRSPLYIASCGSNRLHDVATENLSGSPDDLARLGFAVAECLSAEAPPVAKLSKQWVEAAQKIADALRNAKRPLIVSGSGCRNQSVIEAAANIAKALNSSSAALSLVVPECNSIGLGLTDAQKFSGVKSVLEKGSVDTLVVLENDLYRCGSRAMIDEVFNLAKHLVLIDHTNHETAAKAELILPAATFAETDGTLINMEGRAQRYFPVHVPSDERQGSWEWLRDVGAGDWAQADEIIAACADTQPPFENLADAAPSAKYRNSGMKIPRQPHRYSGRTAMRANIAVSEPKQPVDADSALAFSMEGSVSNTPPSLRAGVWAPAWNSNHAINKFQEEIGGPLRGGDPGALLIESDDKAEWHLHIPKKFKPRKKVWLAAPQQHIFGSEALSVQSSAVAERIPEVSVAMNPGDIEELDLSIGLPMNLDFESGAAGFNAILVADPGIPRGVVGLPYGVPGCTGLDWNDGVLLKQQGQK